MPVRQWPSDHHTASMSTFHLAYLYRIKHVPYDPSDQIWRFGYHKPFPDVQVVLSLHEQTYGLFRLPMPEVQIQTNGPPPPALVTQSVADTGAYIDLISIETLEALGFNPASLLGVETKATGIAPGARLAITGRIFLNVRCTNLRNLRSTQTRCLFYVVQVKMNYLSRSTLESLDIIEPITRELAVIGNDNYTI